MKLRTSSFIHHFSFLVNHMRNLKRNFISFDDLKEVLEELEESEESEELEDNNELEEMDDVEELNDEEELEDLS